ncbi:hypothetical protein [Pseudomonas sp.]|uniref:hypothetical protein n=1 Tax=Pseudomonas sp. TaxID=306 RepID=UPI003A979799
MKTADPHRLKIWQALSSLFLDTVAGEWAGWTDEWLLEQLTIDDQPEVRKPSGSIAVEIARCWNHVATRLPPGYA